MSLDSLFKQNNKKKNDTDNADDQVSGEFRSRAEEESLIAAEASGRGKSKANNANKRTASNRKNVPDETALPEKKRARRRLIGAVALVLAAVIGLPMIFDSEPKPGSQKISIEIPSKDLPASTSYPERVDGNPNVLAGDAGVTQGIDKTEEIVTAPVSSGTATPKPPAVIKPDETRNVVKVESAATQKITEKNTGKKNEPLAVNKPAVPSSPPATNKAAQDATKKIETKLEAKPEAKPEAKKENKDDAARALALLEGRALPGDEVNHVTKETTPSAVKPNAAAGSFTVQVAALNSPEKIRDLQAKLKAANITSYTQKIITKSGEVSRIRVGPFANKAEAEKMRAKLVKLGLNGSLLPN